MRGYEAFFQEALPPIKASLDKALGDREGHFAMAIVEAAQNAAMYARKSPEEVAIDIDLVATESDITVKITADTKDFDVLSYPNIQRNIQHSIRQSTHNDYNGL